MMIIDKLLLSSALLVGCSGTVHLARPAQSSSAPLKCTGPTTYPVVNGGVNAMVLSGSTLYLGGAFDQAGIFTGSGLIFDTTTAFTPEGVHRAPVKGTVYKVIADPERPGGWYIGGNFSSVGGSAHQNLARIRPDGTVDNAWNASADSQVNGLAILGSTLYVSGTFQKLSGVGRVRLGAVDLVTGAVTSWNPGLSVGARIYALAAGGSTVYAGGDEFFGLAAFDALSGTRISWNPSPRFQTSGVPVASFINALLVRGSTLYVGGYFSNIAGETRNSLAAFEVDTKVLKPWNPNSDSIVDALAAKGSIVYIAGSFTKMGGEERTSLAAVDATTGALTPWNPGNYPRVDTIAANDSTVFVGGRGFLTSTTQTPQYGIAALDASSGALTNWNPRLMKGSVHALEIQGNALFVAGDYNNVNPESRRALAAVDITTGALTSFAIGANGPVYSMTQHQSILYIAGDFTEVGGLSRTNLAAIDILSGKVTTWAPPGISSGKISSLTVSGSTLYMGGNFRKVGEIERNYLAGIDRLSGQVTAWDAALTDPTGSGTLFSLTSDESHVYVAGDFTKVDGVEKKYLASFDIRTGKSTAWNPEPDNLVSALAIQGTTLYVGGYFQRVGGSDRNLVAAFDTTTQTLTSWNRGGKTEPFETEYVDTIGVGESVVYLGGRFLNGENRSSIAMVDKTTGTTTFSRLSASVDSLISTCSTLFAAHSFNFFFSALDPNADPFW